MDTVKIGKFLKELRKEKGYTQEILGEKINMTNKIGNFDTGDVLLHEYDFGSTTETLITVIDTVYRKQQGGVRLLARNEIA